MKKVLCYLFSTFIVLAAGTSSARGEDYVSGDFPPETVITKVLTDTYFRDAVCKNDGMAGKTIGVRIIGKIKNPDNSYSVYYCRKICNYPQAAIETIDVLELAKLDTDKWICRLKTGGLFGGGGNETITAILQK